MTTIKSISIDLNDRISENVISEKLTLIENEDSNHLDVEVKNWLPEKTTKLRVNVDLFRKIKEIQELPDWVIIKLLLSEGILGNTGFNSRIING